MTGVETFSTPSYVCIASGGISVVSERTSIEALVLRLAREALESDTVGLDANFFDAGGDSLAALALTAALQEELGRDVPLELVFDTTTLDELARVIARDASA